MSEIDEEFGHYLDSLVEPVEPEWVMGFVARRRRKRALIATGFGVALAATTGVVGYEFRSPHPRDRIGTATGSSTTEAPSTTSTSVGATTSTTGPRPPRSGPGTSIPGPVETTTPPTSGPTSALYRYAQPGDALAFTSFSSSTLTVGVPVQITVTLANTRDFGVFVDDGTLPFAVYLAQPGGDDLLTVGFGALQIDGGVNLPPHAVLTASVQWVPTVASSGTASLVTSASATPGRVNVTQTPTPFTVAANPSTTTTTTTAPVTTTTTTTTP